MDVGRVALKRGPLVYCLEQVDNGKTSVAMFRLPREAALKAVSRSDLFDGIVTVVAGAEATDVNAWDGDLYRPSPPETHRRSSPRCPTTFGTTAAQTRCWSGFRSSAEGGQSEACPPLSSRVGTRVPRLCRRYDRGLDSGISRSANGIFAAGRFSRSLIRQRMMLVDQLLQPVVQHVRIDLRGGDVGVAEQRLHDAKIGAAGEQMRGESVPQHMR